MKFASLPTDSRSSYLLRLEQGDDVHETIQSFCRDHNVSNATLEGIGSVEDPTLAHYSIHTKEFHNQKFQGVYEVASMLGNVALVDDQPFAHVHVTVAGVDLTARAGHLVQAQCSATLEVLVRPYETSYIKRLDDAIGLQVWDL